MKNLILLTNFFPYGTAESYLETEVKYYADFFDKIYVCSLQLRSNDLKSCRNLPSSKFKVLPIRKASNIVYLLYAFLVLGDKNLYQELMKLNTEHRISFKKVVSLFVYLSRSYYEARKIWRWLKTEGLFHEESDVSLYAYRFEYQPYIALLLKKYFPNSITLARGHRFDLYEERRNEGYIPLREYLLDNLNYTVMIAKDGVDYLSHKYPNHVSKVVLSRLGTSDYGLGSLPSKNGPIRIVSCSTVTNVKRVDLIVKALAQINDINVVWDHYGDGSRRLEVETIAKNVLRNNIQYKFHGFIDNPSLMKVYSEVPYHMFLNVSSSEGVPVSIMEAMSFGIPTIATDVGGTKEIVNDNINGYLLPVNFGITQLIECIMKVYHDAMSETYKLRYGARQTWKNKYSADNNYPHFITQYSMNL